MGSRLQRASNNLFTIPAADEIELVNTLPKGYDLYVTVDCVELLGPTSTVGARQSTHLDVGAAVSGRADVRYCCCEREDAGVD